MSASSLLICLTIIFSLFSLHYCGKADKGSTDDGKPPLTKTKLQALAQQIGQDKVRQSKENICKITCIRDLFIRNVSSSRRKRDYIAKSLEQSEREYHLPRDIRGIVVSRGGKWAVEKPDSRDETVGAILEYAEVRVRTKFMDRLKVLEAADKAKTLKDDEKKTYKELSGMDTVNTKPLPQKGCRLSLVVKEDTKLDAYLWELGMAYTSKDVKKHRKTILDLEMLYKVGQEVFDVKIGKREKVKEILKQLRDKRKAEDDKIQADQEEKLSELRLKRAQSEAEKRKLPVEDFLDEEDKNPEVKKKKEEERNPKKVDLSSYATLRTIMKGSGAFSKIAALDFSLMPQKEEENEGNSFKELISLLKEMLLRQYQKLKDHMEKTPEQREQERKNKKKEIDPLEEVFMEETDEEAKKELLNSIGDILKSEDPEISEEKPEESTQNRENYTYLDIIRHNPKPFDFLKEKAHFEIVAKPVGSKFSKLKSRDYISIMRILREENSDYGMLGTETFDKFVSILNENADNVQNCYEVSKYLNKVIYYNPEPTKPDPAHSELLGRLGAQVLNSVINAKKLSIDLSSHMIISIFSNGAISVGLNFFAWPAVIASLCGGTFGLGCPAALPLMVLLYSLTPIIVFSFDAYVMKKLIDKVKNMLEKSKRKGKAPPKKEEEPDMPKTKTKLWDTLKDSMKVGPETTFRSMLNHLLFAYHATSSGALRHRIAYNSSTGLIPLKVPRTQKKLSTALYMRFKDGFFPTPTEKQLAALVPEVRKKNASFTEWLKNVAPWNSTNTVAVKDIIPEERELALLLHAKKDLELTLEVSKSSSLAVNAMGIGGIISVITWITTTFLLQFGAVNLMFSRLIKFCVSQNIFAMTAAIVSSNLVGSRLFKPWLSTDAMKNEQVVSLIFRKTTEQIKDPKGNFKEITLEELKKVYHTASHRVTFKWGKSVSGLLGYLLEGLYKAVGALFGVEFGIAEKFKNARKLVKAAFGKLESHMKEFKGESDSWSTALLEKMKLVKSSLKFKTTDKPERVDNNGERIYQTDGNNNEAEEEESSDDWSEEDVERQ